MEWLKRNLFFVIGGVVALGLMGYAIYYLLDKVQQNNQVSEELTTRQQELDQLVKKKPNAGNKDIDNFKEAQKQQQQVKTWIDESMGLFKPVPHSTAKDEEFNLFLQSSLRQFGEGASRSGVQLPLDFNFSFTAQKNLLKFAPGSVEPVAVQLAEIKVICDILYAARINALDDLRRAAVSADDTGGAARSTDYLRVSLATNEVTGAVISPYEVTFRSFTPELQRVLEGCIQSPHGLRVKIMQVEPASDQITNVVAEAPAQAPRITGPIFYPGAAPAAPRPATDSSASRYGGGSSTGADSRMVDRYGSGATRAAPVAPTAPAYNPNLMLPPPTVASAKPTTPVTLLNERLLKSRLLIEVIRLKPAK